MVIIGAGLAGLVAAYELKRQGHEPSCSRRRTGWAAGSTRFALRARPVRRGGRMRIPRAHDLTLAYCDLFGLPLRPFVMGNPKGLVYIGGERMTAEEANADPPGLPFDLAADERGRTADALWEDAIGEIRAWSTGGRHRLGGDRRATTTSTRSTSS